MWRSDIFVLCYNIYVLCLRVLVLLVLVLVLVLVLLVLVLVLVRFTAGGNIATFLTVTALIISGYMLHAAMRLQDSVEEEEALLDYEGFDIKGVPVSLGVMAYCECHVGLG
jgi:hypothetical protein